MGTYNNYRVKCVNSGLGQCSITLSLSSVTAGIEDFTNYGGISLTYLLDNNTNTFYQTFTSADGETKEVNSVLIKADNYGNTTICNTTSSGTSGTLICNIPVIYQDSAFFAQTYVDGTYIGAKYFTQGVDTEWFGADILIELLMFSSLVLLFIGHPIFIVIGAIIGMISPILLLYSTGMSSAGIIGAVMYYLSAGAIIIIVLRRKV